MYLYTGWAPINEIGQLPLSNTLQALVHLGWVHLSLHIDFEMYHSNRDDIIFIPCIRFVSTTAYRNVCCHRALASILTVLSIQDRKRIMWLVLSALLSKCQCHRQWSSKIQFMAGSILQTVLSWHFIERLIFQVPIKMHHDRWALLTSQIFNCACWETTYRKGRKELLRRKITSIILLWQSSTKKKMRDSPMILDLSLNPDLPISNGQSWHGN